MTKKELYDLVYSKMSECHIQATRTSRNRSYAVLKQYCREHKERHAAYRRDDTAWMAEDLRSRYECEQDHPMLGDAKMAIYQNFRQEYLRHVSNKGSDRAVFDELFEPYRLMWHITYGRDFKGVVTNKPFFWRMSQG